MRYLDIAQGRAAPGLRLVLTAGVPGPWGEAAKAMFAVKKIPYVAVAQEAGGENAELLAWTGQASAPVAVFDDEPPRTDSIDILFLAERLAPAPRLIPADVAERCAMFGIAREIIGRDGLGWERRLMMLAPMAGSPGTPEHIRRLAGRYDCRPGLGDGAPTRIAAILRHLSATLEAQRARGSRYFTGDALSAADIYWAAFSNMFVPLPDEVCPMPGWLRASYAGIVPEIEDALSPALMAHRDFVWQAHIGLPLDFVAE